MLDIVIADPNGPGLSFIQQAGFIIEWRHTQFKANVAFVEAQANAGDKMSWRSFQYVQINGCIANADAVIVDALHNIGVINLEIEIRFPRGWRTFGWIDTAVGSQMSFRYGQMDDVIAFYELNSGDDAEIVMTR